MEKKPQPVFAEQVFLQVPLVTCLGMCFPGHPFLCLHGQSPGIFCQCVTGLYWNFSSKSGRTWRIVFLKLKSIVKFGGGGWGGGNGKVHTSGGRSPLRSPGGTGMVLGSPGSNGDPLFILIYLYFTLYISLFVFIFTLILSCIFPYLYPYLPLFLPLLYPPFLLIDTLFFPRI